MRARSGFHCDPFEPSSHLSILLAFLCRRASLFAITTPLRLNAKDGINSDMPIVNSRFCSPLPWEGKFRSLYTSMETHPPPSIIVGLGFWGFINYYYIYSIVIPYHNIPEPVAKQLRKASFYDQDTKLGDPKKAFKFYAESLAVAHEIGMNPFSEEVLGIRLRIAAFMEKHWQHEAAIELLENIRKQCFAFVDKVGDNHIGDGHRTRVLGLTVKIGVKLGELYNNPNVDNPDAAQAALISAVETYLKEKQRREKDDVQEKEGDWFNDEEAGAALEALGVSYLSGQKSEYALPLFLQALTFCPPSSCHSAVLSKLSRYLYLRMMCSNRAPSE